MRQIQPKALPHWFQNTNTKVIKKPDTLQHIKESNHVDGYDLYSRQVTEGRLSDITTLYDRQSEVREQGYDMDIKSKINTNIFEIDKCLDNIKIILSKETALHRRIKRRTSNTTLFLCDEKRSLTINNRKRRRKRHKRHKRQIQRRQEPSSREKVKQLVKTYFKKINLVPVGSNISFNRKTRRLFKKSLNVKLAGLRSNSLSALKDILYKWTHNQYKLTVLVYPVSGQTLNNYLDSIGNTSQLPSDSMQFELIRLQTFSRYPENASVRPILLAKAGFYYTGNGIEVRCYSCGKTYSDWKQGDSPREIHLRISPHCEHIRRNENDSITLESETENRSRSSIATQFQSNGFENNTEDDEQIQRRHNQEHSQIQRQTQQNHPSPQQQQQQQRRPGHQQEIQNNTTHQSHTDETQSGSSRTQVNYKYDPLGINFDRPKYQAYAVLAVRISSFRGWPSHLTQNAKEMATAGYFYAGYSDYCRCFFCGGGLRNWDVGDDPWVEHARWFPRCQFLRMNKGIAFIDLVQQRLTEKNDQEQNTNLQLTEGATAPASEVVSKKEDIWSHPSIQSVIQMGYSRDTVSDALSRLKYKTIKNGETCPSAVKILETIFAMEQGATGTDEKDDTVKPETKSEDKQECNKSLEAVSNGIETLDITDAQSLIAENRQLKQDLLCKICMDDDASVAFLPCGHLICCGDCAPAMRKCPVCNDLIRGTVKTWLV